MHTSDNQTLFPCAIDADADIGETTMLYILRVAEMITRIGDAKVFCKAITRPQFNVLMILKRHGEDGMSQKDILAYLVSTKGNVSIHISNLLKKRYILRKTSTHDARMHVIKLTAKGKRIVNEVEPKYISQLRAVTDNLPRDQAEATIKLLEHLRLKCDDTLNHSEAKELL